MKNILFHILCISLFAGCSGGVDKQKNGGIDSTLTVHKDTCTDCMRFDTLYLLIRDMKIEKAQAKVRVHELMGKISAYCKHAGMKEYKPATWVFPVSGYNASAVGGKDGEGYMPDNYDFFAGNNHIAHPAQDIFINDKNQDCIDDSTGKEVKVLSMTGGIVISAIKQWQEGSEVRGGICTIIYDPFTNCIFYYAHCRKLFIATGDMVKPGDVIAIMGRSGKNAFEKRSPTHLHLMRMKLKDDGDFEPMNVYTDLLKVKLVCK